MAIDAKSFDEMREHLEALAKKRSLDKRRLHELVDTAKRIAASLEQKPLGRANKPVKPPTQIRQQKPDYWPSTLVEQVDAKGRVITSMPELRLISPLGMVDTRSGIRKVYPKTKGEIFLQTFSKIIFIPTMKSTPMNWASHNQWQDC